jgi:hypothetical protein
MAMRQRGVLRRVVAIACAFAFLTVGLAHGVQHLDVPASAIAAQDASAPSDDPSDTKAPGAAEHCCACTLLAVPVLESGVLLARLSGAPQVPPLVDARAHPPGFETRPPIATI